MYLQPAAPVQRVQKAAAVKRVQNAIAPSVVQAAKGQSVARTTVKRSKVVSKRVTTTKQVLGLATKGRSNNIQMGWVSTGSRVPTYTFKDAAFAAGMGCVSMAGLVFVVGGLASIVTLGAAAPVTIASTVNSCVSGAVGGLAVYLLTQGSDRFTEMSSTYDTWDYLTKAFKAP